MLEVSRLNKSFGDPPHQVLFNINLTIESGDFVAITGRSGSGKSTLLYIISSLDQPDNGFVSINRRDVTKMSVEEIHHFRNVEMGFVFQFHYLLPEFTAIENVLLPARKLKLHEQRRSNAIKLLEEFDLGSKLERYPRELSGGEQQRVAIARALIMEPTFLFADEPTGNLDSQNGTIVMNILYQISKEKKTSVIFVTHDLEYAKRADRRIELVDGRVAGNFQKND